MNVDKIAARNSKIKFIFATYGFGAIKDKKIIKLDKFDKYIVLLIECEYKEFE